MNTAILNATNETTQKVVDSVNCMELGNGDDIRRLVNISTVDWSSLRLTFKYTVVGGGASTAAMFWYGFCSGTRTRNNTNNQHCIGFQTNNNISRPNTAGFGWSPATDASTSPTNDVYGWDVVMNGWGVVTGSSINTGGFTGHFVPRYETVWNPSTFQFATECANPWQATTIEIARPFLSEVGALSNTYQITWQQWTKSPNYTANIPKGAFRQRAQKRFDYEGGGGGTFEHAHGEWGMPNEAEATYIQTFNGSPGFNETAYGLFDSVNFFWSCNDSAKVAVRDIHVVAISGRYNNY